MMMEIIAERSVKVEATFLDNQLDRRKSEKATSEPQPANPFQELAVPFYRLRVTRHIPFPFLDDTITISRALLMDFLRLVANSIRVDEEWYRSTYPDIDKAIQNGHFQDARHHYTEFGYLEDRVPVRAEVDEQFYLTTYPDVKRAIASGDVSSAQRHFLDYGYREGRIPCKGWSLT